MCTLTTRRTDKWKFSQFNYITESFSFWKNLSSHTYISTLVYRRTIVLYVFIVWYALCISDRQLKLHFFLWKLYQICIYGLKSFRYIYIKCSYKIDFIRNGIKVTVLPSIIFFNQTKKVYLLFLVGTWNNITMCLLKSIFCNAVNSSIYMINDFLYKVIYVYKIIL